MLFVAFWVAIRRTYVFTSQEVEKICRTLQSHVILVWTIRSRIASFLQVAILHSGRSGHGSDEKKCNFLDGETEATGAGFRYLSVKSV